MIAVCYLFKSIITYLKILIHKRAYFNKILFAISPTILNNLVNLGNYTTLLIERIIKWKDRPCSCNRLSLF